MPLTFDILHAAQAASDVGAFGLVRDIFERNGVKLCVLCLDQRAEHTCMFRDEGLPVCDDCLGLNSDHQRRVSKATTRMRSTSGDPLPTGRLWVRDYRGHRHFGQEHCDLEHIDIFVRHSIGE
jgi:hypothetical protein